METWEYILSVLPTDRKMGLTQADIRRIYGYSKGTVLRVMYNLTKNRRVGHSDNKPYRYWKNTNPKLYGLMLTKILRDKLEWWQCTQTPVTVTTWHESRTGVLEEWNDRSLCLCVSNDKPSITIYMNRVRSIDVDKTFNP